MAAAYYWHDKLRIKHFENSASTEYGYAPRVGERGNPHPKGFRRSYTGLKLRRKGHTKPLVFSGDSKRQTYIRDIRGTSKRARVVMRAPTYNLKNKHSKINMRDELTRISSREEPLLTQIVSDEVDQGYQAIHETETKVI